MFLIISTKIKISKWGGGNGKLYFLKIMFYLEMHEF